MATTTYTVNISITFTDQTERDTVYNWFKAQFAAQKGNFPSITDAKANRQERYTPDSTNENW